MTAEEARATLDVVTVLIALFNVIMLIVMIVITYVRSHCYTYSSSV